MRGLIFCLIAAVSGFVSAPTAKDLRNTYGRPKNGRFIARRGVELQVKYGPDHRACQITVAPPPYAISSRIAPDDSSHRLVSPMRMSASVVSAIVDELAPEASRGAEIGTGGTVQSSFCSVLKDVEYENISITTTQDSCALGMDPDIAQVLITFKRAVCPTPSKKRNRP